MQFNQADGTVTISVDEYNQLVQDSAILAALQAGGVDNWEWYSESIDDHYVEPVTLHGA